MFILNFNIYNSDKYLAGKIEKYHDLKEKKKNIFFKEKMPVKKSSGK